MTKILVCTTLIATCSMAFAKLPPPDDAAKAKAEEAKARAAWQAKVDGYKLCRVQDKITALYKKTASNPAAKPLVPTAAGAPAAQLATGTPVGATPPAPCIEPGPFAYNPPAQKPLETSGAHSPTGTAASPPSVKENSHEIAPAKKP